MKQLKKLTRSQKELLTKEHDVNPDDWGVQCETIEAITVVNRETKDKIVLSK